MLNMKFIKKCYESSCVKLKVDCQINLRPRTQILFMFMLFCKFFEFNETLKLTKSQSKKNICRKVAFVR